MEEVNNKSFEDRQRTSTIRNGVILPVTADVLSACERFQFRDDDVLIASYPKTGTTWMQEILYLVCNYADTQASNKEPLQDRVPFLELAIPGRVPNTDRLAAKQGQRLMFSHLRADIFEKEIRQGRPKVVLLMRDPKDALTSYYHFYKRALGYPGDWDQFFEIVNNKQVLYGDFFDWYVDWARLRHLPNVFFVRFEDTKHEPTSVVRRLAGFLNKKLSDEQVDEIVRATSFEEMKKQAGKHDNPKAVVVQKDFFRKGIVGDWKNFLSKEQKEYIERKQEEALKPLGIAYV